MSKKVHLIGNAHIDPVWLWSKTDGYTEVLSSFRSALDRMKENDRYIFTCAGAVYYTWIEETDPEMFEEIRARVKEGRWVIVGGWWLQPDCNAPCGESFARHALYSQRYFESKFGIKAKVGYNVDSFGHNAMLPQILKESGMSAYVYMRPNADTEKDYPFEENAFLWEGVDGTQIPAFRIPDGYGSWTFHGVEKKAEQILQLSEKLGIPEMCFYGVGNHGGGPTKENLRVLDELMKENPDAGYGYSSPNEYFEDVQVENMPVLKDDLQHHASGCYTSVMKIKELNRMAESKLMAAEKYWSMAQMLGLKKEKPDFAKSWKHVLFNQFHDIMGGCSVKSGMNKAARELTAALAEAEVLENAAIQAIAWNVGTIQDQEEPVGKYIGSIWGNKETGAPLILFNPHSWDVEAEVHVPFEMAAVCDPDGTFVPVQSVRWEFTNEDMKYRTAFIAKVPAMGWTVYRVYQESDVKVSAEKMLNITDCSMENEWTKITFDMQTGAVQSIFDKKENRELLKAPARSRVVDETAADTWAHAIFTFHDYVGEFASPSFRVTENGAIRGAIEVTTSYGSSQIRQKFIMYREKPGVYVEYKVLWLEKHKMLKLSFPTVLEEASPVSSIPYGFMKRKADGKDYPMQKWVALMSDNYGLGIATDTRTAYDVENGELCITALRSPIYADHFGNRDIDCEYTEQGEHEFKLYINTVKESTLPLHQAAEELILPPEAIYGSDHRGKLPITRGMACVDQRNVEISVVKFAEDSCGDYIIRCHETEGKEVSATITVGNVTFTAEFTPQQIRTFRIDGNTVTDSDLIESV